jgi:hypothetical protein
VFRLGQNPNGPSANFLLSHRRKARGSSQNQPCIDSHSDDAPIAKTPQSTAFNLARAARLGSTLARWTLCICALPRHANAGQALVISPMNQSSGQCDACSNLHSHKHFEALLWHSRRPSVDTSRLTQRASARPIAGHGAQPTVARLKSRFCSRRSQCAPRQARKRQRRKSRRRCRNDRQRVSLPSNAAGPVRNALQPSPWARDCDRQQCDACPRGETLSSNAPAVAVGSRSNEARCPMLRGRAVRTPRYASCYRKWA